MKTKLLLLLLFILLTSPAILHADTIRLATGEWKPYTSESLENFGFFTEIVSEIFKEMGVEAEYSFYPWKRCFDSTEKGKVWAAFPYAYTEERAKKVLYSDEIAYSTSRFFYYIKDAKAKDFKYETLQDLKQYKVGGILGYFYEEDLKKAGLDVDYVASERSAIEKLVLGRIELWPSNELVGWALIKKYFPKEADNFGTLEKPYSRNALCLIVSKKYPNSKELLRQFNAAFIKIKDKGIYDSILKKYNIKILGK